jgi:type IV secretory pathway TrbD component
VEEAEALYRRYLAYGLFIWSVARASIVPVATLKPLLHRFAMAADEAGTVAALIA